MTAPEGLSGLAARLSNVAGRLDLAGRRWEEGEDTQTTLAGFLRALADLIEIRVALQALAFSRASGVAATVEELAGDVTAALGWVQTGTRTPAMPADMDTGVARLRDVVHRLRVLAAVEGGHEQEGGPSDGR